MKVSELDRVIKPDTKVQLIRRICKHKCEYATGDICGWERCRFISSTAKSHIVKVGVFLRLVDHGKVEVPMDEQMAFVLFKGNKKPSRINYCDLELIES